MKIIKSLFITGLIISAAVCISGCVDKKLNIQGETLIPPYYARNILPMIDYYIDSYIVSGCKSVTIIDSKVINPPADKKNSLWSEEWTVDACGKTLLVPVKFYKNGNKIQTLIKSGDIIEK